MTYCLAIKVNEGLVFAADTRTNAGPDYVTQYKKLYLFDVSSDRAFVLLSAGNLGTTQEIVHWMQRDLLADDERETLNTVNHLFEAANYVGRVSMAVLDQHRESFARSGIAGETSLILGGQIRGEEPDIFLIYPQGNFIEASDDTPFLQIGENKYGKPMLDRLVDLEFGLNDAVRLALVSLDATVRSNVTVGAPFDVAVIPTNELLVRQRRFSETGDYLQQLRTAWERGLSEAFEQLPAFGWD